MKRHGKLLSILLICALVCLSCNALVFADDKTQTTEVSVVGGVSGSGTVEGFVDEEVFSVDVPLSSSVDFGFIIDPGKFITLTNAVAHPDWKNFERGATIFFNNNEEGKRYDHSSISDAFKITNNSSVSIDVAVDATLEGLGNVKLTDDRDFTGDKSMSLYMAIVASVDGQDVMEYPIINEKQTLNVRVPGARGGSYAVSWNEASGYYYGLVSDDEDDFSYIALRLTGKANPNALWINPGNTDPNFELSWTVQGDETGEDDDEDSNADNADNEDEDNEEPEYGVPELNTTTYKLTAGSALPISFTCDGEMPDIRYIYSVASTGEKVVLNRDAYYTFENGTLTLNEDLVNSLVSKGISREYTAVFDNKDKTALRFKVEP
ncbi:MAG: hypothetical protein K6F99_11140 [Lachnospiraceae bacterium]|nr:hypothetical protein [Lachnospiraceae bacterium]